MKKTINRLLFLFIGILLVGCGTQPTLVAQQIHSSAKHPILHNYDLASLYMKLPLNWGYGASNIRSQLLSIIDDQGQQRGTVELTKDVKGFDYRNALPNHSVTTDDEQFKMPLGTCRLITRDMDNGTAVMGVTGTHNEYYAFITIQDQAIVTVNFSKKDKDSKTKEEFIEILKSMKWNLLSKNPTIVTNNNETNLSFSDFSDKGYILDNTIVSNQAVTLGDETSKFTMLYQGYKRLGFVTSPSIPCKPFSRAKVNWIADLSNGTGIQVYIRGSYDGVHWTEWQIPEHSGDEINLGDDVIDLQFWVHMFSKDVTSNPVIRNLTIIPEK